MTVLIKRYANRKLYNTDTSRYITLKGIAELIERGDEVRVIDNETGEDITSVALSQILVDSERTSRSVPGSLLSDLIHRGGDALYGALRKGVDDASEGIEDIQRNVRRAIRTGGERRISNFLLWNLAYTELYFTDLLWPDFDAVALDQALEYFAGKQRRFGRTGAQIADGEHA